MKRSTPNWASWSTWRVIGVALLYGLCVGGLVGATEAVIRHHTLRDALELVAFDIALWCAAAAGVLLLTRHLARHPRRRR